MNRIRGKLTYANVISTLCLVLLLGGGSAYAASQFGRETIGTGALKKEAVTPAKLSKKSKAALTGAAGPAGAKGATGPQGPQGTPGAPGATNVTVHEGAEGTTEGSTANCGPGEVAVGGGGFATEGFLWSSIPALNGEELKPGQTPNSWHTQAENETKETGTIAWVVCTKP